MERIHQRADEPRLVVVGTAGAEAGGQRDELVVGMPVADRVVLTGRGTRAQRIEWGDAGRQRGRVDRVDETVDVGDVGHVDRVLDDQMGHCTRLSNMLCMSAR